MMFNFPVGAMLESFKLPFREAVETAAKISAQGLQIYMSKPTVTYYEDLTPARINKLMDIIKSNGLVVSAICGDFKLGFGNPETNPLQIERSHIDYAILTSKIMQGMHDSVATHREVVFAD